ncbi:hypothetical protein GYMLUDRAFT_157806 [Collybiopsis luxurians FD-317 M1]|nr:hypothetical protein GYMLUDRAFT_157806 [Collybiopsis luxurians FD-317 M1]
MSHTAHLPLLVADFLLPTSAASPADPDSRDCGSFNCRTKFQIIWSCIAVLVACTWVSVHPNIPGPTEGTRKVLTRKIGLMMLSLLAPELLVMWAARQTVDAWLLTEKYRHQGWTTSHAMFALMGGFALYKDNKLVSVLRFYPVEIREPHADFIGRIPECEIKDRSRVDWFGKFIAIGQTSWFIAQLFARWDQNLAITELELMTVAFATLNFIVYFLWWDKPQGVGCHIRIPAVRSTSDAEKQEHGYRSESAVKPSRLPSEQRPSSHQSIPFWMEVSLSSFFILAPPLHLLFFIMGKLRHSLLGSFHQIQAWWSSPNNPTSTDIDLEKAGHYIRLVARFLVPTRLYVITVLQHEGPWDRVLSFEWDPYDIAEEHSVLFSRATSLLFQAAVAFGAIHCAAWNFPFPTSLEQLLWRISSLMATLMPILYTVFLYIGQVFLRRCLGKTLTRFLAVTFDFIILLLYISARLALIIQSFLALRDLPPSALQGVVWSTFIPHI